MNFDGRTVDIFLENNRLGLKSGKNDFITGNGLVNGEGVGKLSDTYSIPIDKVYRELEIYHDVLNNYGEEYVQVLKGIKQGTLNKAISKNIDLQKLEYYLIRYAEYDPKLNVISGINNIEKVRKAKEIDNNMLNVLVLTGTENISLEDISNYMGDILASKNLITIIGGGLDGVQ